MPIDYKKYPANWKSEIRPRILQRANNKCECCGVSNYAYIFRGTLECGKEVYQTENASVYDASNSEFLFQDYFAIINPSNKKENAKAIKVILTIAHLDHDETNFNVSDDRLKAVCQKCHLTYDAKEKSKRRKVNKLQTTLLSIFISLGLFSCDIQKEASKQKNDIEFTERIETKEIRKGDTVTYIVPNVIYKDTVITTVSRKGTILKTYYDNKGNISKSDCIGTEIELLRNEIRTLNDKTITKEKTKEESYFDNPLLWLIIALAAIVLLKK